MESLSHVFKTKATLRELCSSFTDILQHHACTLGKIQLQIETVKPPHELSCCEPPEAPCYTVDLDKWMPVQDRYITCMEEVWILWLLGFNGT